MRKLLDACITELDVALKVVTARARGRPADIPAGNETSADATLSEADRDRSARLMRINHSGEIAAQALYRGQALTARDDRIRAKLLAAARDEHSHLLWCDHRVRELGSHPSYLAPIWYGGSFVIGALVGLAGDKTSLGFLAETEKQVTEHLDGHLDRLPGQDRQSRRILERMRADEQSHEAAAIGDGAGELSDPARRAMRSTASVMTTLSYWI